MHACHHTHAPPLFTHVRHHVDEGDDAHEAKGRERGVGRLHVGLVVEHVVADEGVHQAVEGVEEELQREVGAVVAGRGVEARAVLALVELPVVEEEALRGVGEEPHGHGVEEERAQDVGEGAGLPVLAQVAEDEAGDEGHRQVHCACAWMYA